MTMRVNRALLAMAMGLALAHHAPRQYGATPPPPPGSKASKNAAKRERKKARKR